MGKPWTYGMENKFLVIKHEDMEKYLDDCDLEDLEVLLQRIGEGRYKEGKQEENRYLIVNVDETYAEQVADIMKENGHWG